MSLENEINRLKRAKIDIRASLKTKIGLEIGEDIKLDKYGECINNVESTCTHINGDFYNVRTNNGTNFYNLFYGCQNLTSIDLSNWDTSKVTNMGSMFYLCGKLTTLDVSNWKTSSVTNMSDIFYQCYELTTLDVSNWDTSKVTDMRYMFCNCQKLTTLDVSNWDTSKVTNMSYMFYRCNKLTTLDLSSFNTSNVATYTNMLGNIPAACTIYINPNTFINKSTGQTFTPADLGWKGTEFTPKYN